MPAPYGVTDQGWSGKTLEEVKQDVENDLEPLDLDLSASSPLGQIVGSFSSHVAEIWELGQAIFDSYNSDAATGFSLANAALLTGTIPQGPKRSTVVCICDLDAGDYPARSLVAHVAGKPDDRFRNVAAVTSTGGPNSVEFESEAFGPVNAFASTLTFIAAPVTGWNSVNNGADAIVGQLRENDSALRERRLNELAASGATNPAALAAELFKVAGVIDAQVYENDTKETDLNGLPASSMEPVVFDGSGQDADDDQVAQAIWDNKPGGIEIYGVGSSGVAVDAKGNAHTVAFSRGAITQALIQVVAEVNGDFPADGEAQIRQDVASWIAENVGVGDTLHVSILYSVIHKIPGVVAVTTLGVGTDFVTYPPSLSVGAREIIQVDSSFVFVSTSVV